MIALALSVSLLFGQADEAKAKALYREGETAYNLGQFETALAKYSDAYRLKALPGFLFNIAQCHKQLGQFERAAFFYGRFIDTAGPRAPNVELARSLQAEMKLKESDRAAREADEKRKADEQRRAEEKARDELKHAQLTPIEPVVAPPPPPPVVVTQPAPAVVADEPVYKKGWFWGVVVGVVVAAGVATTVGVVAAPKPPSPSLGPELK